jgi:hypothetical protein
MIIARLDEMRLESQSKKKKDNNEKTEKCKIRLLNELVSLTGRKRARDVTAASTAEEEKMQ